MGNHTWFYKKSNITLQDCKKRAINNLQYYIDLIKNSDDLDFNKEHYIKTSNRIIDWIKNNKITNACYRLLDEIGYFDSKTKIYYVSDKELPHDTFRVDDYLNLKLYSFQETVDFLEKNDSKIRYSKTIFDKTDREVLKKNAIEELKKFWDENPDGMIDFG